MSRLFRLVVGLILLSGCVGEKGSAPVPAASTLLRDGTRWQAARAAADALKIPVVEATGPVGYANETADLVQYRLGGDDWVDAVLVTAVRPQRELDFHIIAIEWNLDWKRPHAKATRLRERNTVRVEELDLRDVVRRAERQEWISRERGAAEASSPAP